MNVIYPAESIKSSYEFASNATAKLRRLMLDGATAYSPEGLRREAEFAYANLIDSITALNTVLLQIPEPNYGKGAANDDVFVSHAAPFHIQCYFESEHIFRCVMETTPLLKTQTAGRKYFEHVCLSLQREVVKVTAGAHIHFAKAIVIFVNHWVSSAVAKQPYYDNDNLALKGILDSIVPFICFDDASVFCDNIYLAQPDNAGFTEVFIVEEGHLMEWASGHREIAFVGEMSVVMRE